MASEAPESGGAASDFAPESFEIRRSGPDDLSLAQEVAAIVNAAYQRGEAGMWHSGELRTNTEEVSELIKQRRLLLAIAPDGRLAGSCDLDKGAKDDGSAEFGMLAVHDDFLGKGIGKRIITAAIDTARAEQCVRIKLAILRPEEWSHPMKERLHAWYSRLGFQPVTGPLAVVDYAPEYAERLSCPCVFTEYAKPLEVASS